MKTNYNVFKTTLAAIFLAVSYILPFFTAQISEIGTMFCPMHIPVILCSFICGWQWGLAVGFIAPLLRSLTLFMPPLFPTAVSMAFELAVYGFLSGFMYNLLPKKKIHIYTSLITAMFAGRLVWGACMFTYTAFKSGTFTFSTFLAGAFLNSVPGIVLQIILIPIIVITSKKINLNN